MPKKQKEITCKESDLIVLQRMSQNELEPPRVQERAKMILDLLDGKMIKDVAAEFRSSRSVVSHWRDRFSSEGPSGLYDQDRPGRGGEANRGIRDKVVAHINDHSDADPPLSAQSLAQEYGVSESTIFRIMDQEDLSLSRQRKWYVGYTQTPQAKSTDMVGLYVSDVSRIMVVCTNRDGLLPDVRGALRTKNRLLAEAISRSFSDPHPDLIDLLQSAQEYRKAEHVRHTRFDENQFLETAFDSLPKDASYEYTIFSYQETDCPLKLAIPNLTVRLKRIAEVALWNENAAMIFDLLNAPKAEDRTGADLVSAIDDFAADFTASSEPFAWIKRMPRPDGPETAQGFSLEDNLQTESLTDGREDENPGTAYA